MWWWFLDQHEEKVTAVLLDAAQNAIPLTKCPNKTFKEGGGDEQQTKRHEKTLQEITHTRKQIPPHCRAAPRHRSKGGGQRT
ncbi:hypothetical protein E2C01_042902 [Portunus trituberculatus]|uniref:Uncharacterized protein n=1 Tax=Portunus trituberculatus TaxID=210409 RepID=A0A5B7FW07_PORTR|nr:hypothetical protein [Portunus trituberculatus]